MQLSVALRQRISNLVKSKNLNLNKLATLAGIPTSTITSFMAGKSNDPTMSTMLHICEAFELSLSEFFDDPLFDNVMSEEKDDEIYIKK